MEEAHKIIKKEIEHNNVNVQFLEDDPKDDQTSPDLPRFTRTGKVSHAKTRVYTQRYRKEWENMSDFKDWLTSVPGENTRAFCKFCDRNLHAHRLSLLKHMCTLKHQRASAHFQREQMSEVNKSASFTSFDESLENEDEFENCSYVLEDDTAEGEEVEEVIQECESPDESPDRKKLRIDKDALTKALIENSNHDFLDDTNDDEISLQMENSDDEEGSLNIKLECKESRDNIIIKEVPSSSKTDDDDTISSKCEIKSVNLDNKRKMIILTSNGKPLTLMKGSKLMVNASNNKNYTVAKLVSADSLVKFSNQSRSTTIAKLPTISSANYSLASTSALLKQKSPIVSTFVLETSKGAPVCGLAVSLYKLLEGRWTFIEESMTNINGISDDFADKKNLSSGRYKLHYDVEKYYQLRKLTTIYPFIEIVFDIKNPRASHHTPLYISPYSFSTFKDQSK